MAHSDLALTVLPELRADYDSSSFDKLEIKDPNAGALATALKQNSDPESLVNADIAAKAQNAFGRALKVPVVDYSDITLGNSRTCAMQSFGLNSKLLTVTKQTISFGISMAPVQYYQNEISYRADLMKKLNIASNKVRRTLDTAVIARLEAGKNAFWKSGAIASKYFAVSGDSLIIPQAQKDELYNALPSISKEFELGGSYSDIITSPKHEQIVRRLAAQGSGNSINQAFQFDGYSWAVSNQIADRTGVDLDGAGGATATGNVESTIYALQPGSIGILFTVDPTARLGYETTKGTIWSQVADPFSGIPMGLRYQSECTDASAYQAAGVDYGTAEPVESWHFSFDYYLFDSYVSNRATMPSGILKAEVMK